MRALLYLTIRRFLNSIKQIPRQPRLLVPYLLMGLFLLMQGVAFFALHNAGAARPGLSPAFTPNEFLTGGPGALIAAVRGILLLSLLTSIVQAMGEGSLFFTQSDMDFLFPAPLSRRAVLLFKMLGRYLALIFPAAYLPLLVGTSLLARAGTTPLAYLPGIFGTWLFMITAANLTQAALLARGTSDDGEDPADEARAKRRERARRVISGATTVLLLGILGLVFYAMGNRENRGLLEEVLRVVNSRTATLLLAPVAWASDLYRVAFEGWTLADAGRLLGLLALAVGSLGLLFSRERDFYEGVMDFSQKQARMVSAMRQGDAGSILSQMAQDGKLSAGRTLRDFGMGARAILWKDAVSLTRTPLRSWLTLLFLASFPAFFSLIFGKRQNDIGLVFWLVMFTVQTSSLFLLGLRDMLRRADITKALPVSPGKLLLAELAFSALQMTILGWLSMGIMWLLGSGRGPVFAAALVVFPSVAALILFVQTCFVLVYPVANQDAAQNGISGLLSLLASMLALLPGVIAGILLSLANAPPVLLGLGVAVVNAVAAACAFAVATFLWQRFAPTS